MPDIALSATLAKSGPLDFPLEKNFLLFFERILKMQALIGPKKHISA